MRSQILLLVFFTILLTSFFNVLYNSGKLLVETNKWVRMSDYEKRHEIFGNLYDFILLIDSVLPNNSSILVFTNNDMMHLLGRYHLYPKRITVVKNESDFKKNYKNYEYFATYNKNVSIKVLRVKYFESRNKKDYGFIYKNE